MAKKKRVSKADKVLAYMKEKGGITPLEAWQYCSCYRLGARIFELKANGNNIKTEKVKVKCADGTTAEVARYVLIKEAERA